MGDLLVLENTAPPDGSITLGVGRELAGRFRKGGDVSVQAAGGWSDEMEWTGEWQLDGGTGCLPDLTSEVELPVDVGPQGGYPLFPPLPVPVTTTWNSLRERRVLFELSAYVGGISATVKDGVAKVRGAGCEVDVPLTSSVVPGSAASAGTDLR
jgi:hypothetical protein